MRVLSLRMKTIILLSLLISVSFVSSKPRQSPEENQNALLKVIKKRNTGCYSGCTSSCNTCNQQYCSSACTNCISNTNCCNNNNCCQNQCQVCHTQQCQQNVNCAQCCSNICYVRITSPSIPVTSTASPTTTRSTPPTGTTTPGTTTFAIPTPVRYSSGANTSNINTQNVQVSNRVSYSNNIRIPINISNINVNRNSVNSQTQTEVKPGPTPKEPIVSPITAAPKPTTSPDNDNVIIINIPHYQPPITFPVQQQLPCFSQSQGCVAQRPYWSGSLCSGAGGFYGHNFGSFGSYGGYGGFSGFGSNGCTSIYQDCSLCGSNFYNDYNFNSLEYGCCYGCFI